MLNERQIEFLDKYSQFFEGLPSLKTVYSFATKSGLTHQEIVELLFYYAECSKVYNLKIVKQYDPVDISTRITLEITNKIEPRDSYLVTNLRNKETSWTGGIPEDKDVITQLSELIKVSYNVDLSKLKNMLKYVDLR